jgi:hypothetical protein
MQTPVRLYRPTDTKAVVELAIRAWAPVFASLDQVLGRQGRASAAS